MPTDQAKMMLDMEELDWEKIHPLVASATAQLRHGEAVTTKKVGNVRSTEIFAMPHTSEVTDEQAEKVNMIFIDVGIERKKADSIRNELVALLAPAKDSWMEGPSYIHLGAACGDQGRALMLMALGTYYKFWDLITPVTLLKMDPNDPQCRQMAGGGFIMIQGWWPDGKPKVEVETSPEPVKG